MRLPQFLQTNAGVVDEVLLAFREQITAVMETDAKLTSEIRRAKLLFAKRRARRLVSRSLSGSGRLEEQ